MSGSRAIFEMASQDAAGRIGELTVPRSGTTVETPTVLPVVHPNRQTVDPARLGTDFGAEMVITNAYIIHGDESLRTAALDAGLHELLGFRGPIMTDSGSFQLAEYGSIDVDNETILRFQRAIGSDVGTPIDVPTPPDADREAAEADLRTTETRLEAAAAMDTGDMLVSAPIQGSTHPALRTRAASFAAGLPLDVYPIGAVVPLLTDYRFAAVIDAVMAAKRGLGADAPVHLFGAGHPMMFALAVAAGCDLFDSAAYALYAREGRYLTVRGTKHLDDLTEFPCSCPICLEYTPEAVRESGQTERLLSEHNLHVTFEEVRRVKGAIREGSLLELVDARARGHPALLDGYRALLDHRSILERTDPVRKGTFFSVSAECARRPEVARHHDRLGRLDVPDRVAIVGPSMDPSGWPSTSSVDAIWPTRPPFGPVPPELAETYPVNAERPVDAGSAAIRSAFEGIIALARGHPDSAVLIDEAAWPVPDDDPLPTNLRPVRRAVESTDKSESEDEPEQ